MAAPRPAGAAAADDTPGTLWNNSHMSEPRKQPVARHLVLFAVVSVLALLAGYWVAETWLGRQPDLSALHATRFSEPRPLQPFELVDHTGKPFTNADLRGGWTFVFFGYTHCPDVCPTTLSVLNSVARHLEAEGRKARFVFVSIDPGRDTPEVLGQYVAYFNGEFTGVTGTEQALADLTRQLGVVYLRVASDDSQEAYLLDHTASVLLFDPDGRLHAIFPAPLNAAQVEADFALLTRARD
jgi:protein SCO1/2